MWQLQTLQVRRCRGYGATFRVKSGYLRWCTIDCSLIYIIFEPRSIKTSLNDIMDFFYVKIIENHPKLGNLTCLCIALKPIQVDSGTKLSIISALSQSTELDFLQRPTPTYLDVYPQAFLKKQKGILQSPPTVRLSIRPSVRYAICSLTKMIHCNS